MSPEVLTQLVVRAAERARGLRRQLHQMPELLYEEHQTAATIRHSLDASGIVYTAGLEDAPTATIALIGDPSRPCVALRADIDALPIEEESDLPHRSKRSGCMHACGHDGHTAALIGAAEVLKALEAELPTCVKLIFQPAEEAGAGAERLIKAGVLDGRIGPTPQIIFGLHGWPAIPLGHISTRSGPILAATDNFLITIRGRGAHGAFPHLSRDPIVAAAETVLSLQQIVSREIDPIDSAVVTIGRFLAGTASNIIPNTATLEGTARTLSPRTRIRVRDAIIRRVKGICDAHDLTFDLEWIDGYPPTVNDPAATDYVRATTRTVLGPDAFIQAAAPSMGGEDFAYYLEQVPGCFAFIGLCPPGQIDPPGLHHPRFDFNDDALPAAIRLLVGLASGWSEKVRAVTMRR